MPSLRLPFLASAALVLTGVNAGYTSYANDFVDPDYIVAGNFSKNTLGAQQTIVNWAKQSAVGAPWSVVDKPFAPPSGDKHDYLSWAPYWWPDCSGAGNTTALTPEQIWTTCPYKSRDGQFNPDARLVNNIGAFDSLADAVFYNTMAWSITEDDSYAKSAASWIETWFIDNSTRMNPNLNYAQVIRGPGSTGGTHTGVLDLKCMVKIVSGILILRKGKSPAWTTDLDNNMNAWVTQYISWLETAKIAIEEAEAANNHGSFYFNQLAALKILLGDLDGARNVTDTFFSTLYPAQIIKGGEQPFEAVRTRPYHYRAYNLAAMITNARLAEYAKPSAPVWNETTTQGATIQDALDFAMTISPSASGESAYADELYPNVAAVASVYGDPDGKYAAFLSKGDPQFTLEANYLWDQPFAVEEGLAANPSNSSTSSGLSGDTSKSKANTQDNSASLISVNCYGLISVILTTVTLYCDYIHTSMSSEDSDLPTTSTVDKGKRRADVPTERTPLLQNESYGSTSRDIALFTDTPPSSRQRLRSILTTVFLVSLSLCIIIAVFFSLLAWSYASKASRLVPDRLLNEDVVVDGPFGLDVLNTTDDGGLWLNVSGRVGFDAGHAIGVNKPSPGESDNWLKQIWKAIGRWGIQTLDTVTVELDTIRVAPQSNQSILLLSAQLPPVELPLTVDPPRRTHAWLTPIVTEVFVQPTRNGTVMANFLAESWKRGSFEVDARVRELRITGGGKNGGWKANFHGKMKKVQTSIRMKIPSLPGLPQPGKHAPFPNVSDFLTLKTFRVESQEKLSLYAEAEVINPSPENFSFSVPSLPLIVSLPNGTNSSVPVANLSTLPFKSTHPNITMYVEGTVPALPKSSFPLLSAFLSRYLNGESNPILISTPLFSSSDPSEGPGFQIPAEFPAPNHRPNLLRNVTIKDMRIRPSGTTFLANGVVFAKVVLPKGMDVGVDVFRVFPDVLVFDGEAPDDFQDTQYSWPHRQLPGEFPKRSEQEKAHSLPPSPPLPDPLPPHAFGHIRPEDWLPSLSVRLDDDEDDGGEDETGAVYAVSAKVIDVPLQMLPGRSREFTNFVGKVIFRSDGAVAGIEGFAAVTLEVDGLPISVSEPAKHRKNGDKGAMLELMGLPVRGSVRVGKKGF
ncbi:hypothetical protein NP233_g1459 [Leucocoprinus birnbaumii]|uniref:Alginate lyase domain-containing protein n=1 Tax=Leucocoprinus birnbaumii TaxID=56174 RepID=A0AAD5W422_9AGAR|nr:hypothetical protein NP233_g1459 [Leucocoprinus birnbaumii]